MSLQVRGASSFHLRSPAQRAGRRSVSLLFAASLVLGSIGCSGTESADSAPHPAAIVPDHALPVQPVEVVIQGTGFLAKASQSSSGGAAKLDTTHRAWLDEVELDAVTWVDSQTLRATVPAGLSAGPHTLLVQNALGQRGSLENAYTVITSVGLAGSLSSDRATTEVGQQFTLTLTLRNGGDGDLTEITCSMPVITTTDGGGARPVGAAPTPPTSIPAHAERSVAWTFEATSLGHIALTVTATAFDAFAGRTVNADMAGPAQVLIQAPGTPPAPGAPTGVTATAVSQARIDVAWNAVSDATGYQVLRGALSGGPYTRIATSTTPTYADTSVSAAATYYYVVQATNAGGTSPSSAEASATTPAPPPTAPPAPTGVTATAKSQTRIDLTWNAVSGATYQILRGDTSGGPYAQIGTATSATYADTAGLVAATTYYYVVRATSAGGTSANSAEASATTLAPPPPPRPTGLTATAISQTRIDLTWTAASGATGYVVLRGTTSGGPYNQIATTTTAGYSDMSVSAAATYYYVVQATNAGGTSPSSVEASATTPAPPPTAPPAPTGITATAVSQARIDVAWSSVAGATAYDVLRGTAPGGPYARIGTTAAVSLSDTMGLAPLTTYYYVVQATSAGGSSPYSAEASATTLPPPPPPAPTGLAATAASQTRIDLAWNAASGATGYVVLRGTTSGGPYTQIATTTTPGYSDTNVLAAATYYYVVQATNAGGASPISAEASATTPAPPPVAPSAPTGLAATALSQTRIDLAWNAASGATGYVVLRGTASGGPYTQVATTTTPGFSDTTVSAATTYYYVVRATNAGGTSPNSAEASATTLAPPPPPAPTGLSAKAQKNARITLTWNSVAVATGYDVFRSTVQGGPYSRIGTSTPTTTTTSYNDSGLTAGTTYYYVVQAVNAAGHSQNSNEASATANP